MLVIDIDEVPHMSAWGPINLFHPPSHNQHVLPPPRLPLIGCYTSHVTRWRVVIGLVTGGHVSFTRRGHGLHVTVLPRMQLPVPEYQYVCSGKKGDKECLGSGRSTNNIFLHCTDVSGGGSMWESAGIGSLCWYNQTIGFKPGLVSWWRLVLLCEDNRMDQDMEDRGRRIEKNILLCIKTFQLNSVKGTNYHNERVMEKM